MNKQKKKRAVSAEGEGPATAETTDPPLVPIAVCYESGKPGILNMRDPSKERRAGRASARASPLFPVKIDGKEPYQVKAITSLLIYVRTPLFQGGAALPPANPAISEPVFSTPFNSMEDFSILAIPGLLLLYIYIIIIKRSSPFSNNKVRL